LKNVLFEAIRGITYQEAWDIQTLYHKALIEQKMELRRNPDALISIPHKIFFCEHSPVFTLGKSGSMENLLLSDSELEAQHIEFFKINRGGDITYHGPGQITGYPILDLEFIYTDIHRYVRDMEEAIIQTIKHYGIVGERIEGYTGVWIRSQSEELPHRKICAIGVHMSRWVSLHGFALNVNTDLSYFNKIIPCGIEEKDKEVTSIAKEIGRTVDLAEVEGLLEKYLCEVYGLKKIDQ
jgi:lipoyl(octanoyl) transferase